MAKKTARKQLCPICGARITIAYTLHDGRSVGSCGDAFANSRKAEVNHIRDCVPFPYIAPKAKPAKQITADNYAALLNKMALFLESQGVGKVHIELAIGRLNYVTPAGMEANAMLNPSTLAIVETIDDCGTKQEFTYRDIQEWQAAWNEGTQPCQVCGEPTVCDTEIGQPICNECAGPAMCGRNVE